MKYVHYAILAIFMSIPVCFQSAWAKNKLLIEERLESLSDSLELNNLDLEISLNGGLDPATVQLGQEFGYSIVTPASGFLYLFHVDSHGKTSLLRIDTKKIPAVDDELFYPGEDGGLLATAPLGRESVFGFLLSKDISELKSLFGNGDLVNLGDDLKVIEKRIKAFHSDKRHVLAASRLDYFVEAEDGKFGFNSRGLVRNYKEKAHDLQSQWTQSPSGDVEKEAVSQDVQIQFEFDSAELTESGRMYTDIFGEYLRETLATRREQIVIVGHTDAVGREDYNLYLSERRAKSVKDYLINNFDIPPEALSITGYGESRPIADNNDNNGRFKNRRVEFSISITKQYP